MNLEEKILKARNSYYNNSNEYIISDEEYDSLIDELLLKDPNNYLLQKVGIEENSSSIVIHSIPMLSMNKASNKNDLFKYLNLFFEKENQLIIEPKIDGVSADIYYKSNILQFISSRGNGIKGSRFNISSNTIKSMNIPLNISLNNEIHIRGEIYIPKRYKEELNTISLRNFASGCVKRKEAEDLSFLRFIPYYINYFNNDYDRLNFFKENSFKEIPYKNIKNLEEFEIYYEEYLKNYREEFEFETDGLVIQVPHDEIKDFFEKRKIVSHYHHYNIAFKPPSAFGETELIDIEWNVSKEGKLIPTGIVNPVKIGNVEYKRVTLNNSRFIENNNIFLGDIVSIKRCNDVIPNIISSKKTEKSKKIELTKCPICGKELLYNGVYLICENEECRIVKKISNWFKKNDILGMAEKGIEKLVKEYNIKHIFQLYEIEEECYALSMNCSLTTSKFKKFIDKLEQTRNLSEFDVLKRYGLPNFTEKNLEKFGLRTINDIENISQENEEKYKSLKELKKWIKENKSHLLKLMSYTNQKEELIESKKDTKKICLHGKFNISRKEIENILKKENIEVVNIISKNVDYLIASDFNGEKVKKAKNLGIKIIHLENGIFNKEKIIL